MQIPKNVRTLDRIARLVAGGLLVILAATGVIGVWGWLGLIFVGTAFISFCPFYRIVDLKTCQNC